MTPEEEGRAMYLGRLIFETLRTMPMALSGQAREMQHLRLPMSSGNSAKLTWPLSVLLDEVSGELEEYGDEYWAETTPQTLPEMEALAAKLEEATGRTGLAHKAIEEAQKRPRETEAWLSTLAEDPTPEMIFERLTPDEWRKLTTSSSPSPGE